MGEFAIKERDTSQRFILCNYFDYRKKSVSQRWSVNPQGFPKIDTEKVEPIKQPRQETGA
jgi:hypothetical protein